MLVGAIALVGTASAVGPQRAGAQTCFAWSGQLPLQQAVDANLCVEVQAGTYDLDQYLLIADGRLLQGDPDVAREQIVLRARAPWNTNGNEGVITGFQPPHTSVATIRHLTVDANHLATGGIGASDLTIDDVVVRHGRCWGVAIVGPNMTVTDSRIEQNGADPSCPSPPGDRSVIHIPNRWDLRAMVQLRALRCDDGDEGSPSEVFREHWYCAPRGAGPGVAPPTDRGRAGNRRLLPVAAQS